MPSFAAGFGTGLSLILAIGAQNAFVLRQGLLRRHVFRICLLCALSDALLIVLGVAGMASALRLAPGLAEALGGGGFPGLEWRAVVPVRMAGRRCPAAGGGPAPVWPAPWP